jgi:hypothetical protein
MSTGPSHEVVWVQVGSTEWVEQNIDLSGLNAVAYLNIDTGVGGSGFSAGASPQLDGLLQEVTKQVSFANSAGDVLLLLTILIGWLHWRNAFVRHLDLQNIDCSSSN